MVSHDLKWFIVCHCSRVQRKEIGSHGMVQAVSAVVLEVKGAGRLQNACSVEKGKGYDVRLGLSS